MHSTQNMQTMHDTQTSGSIRASGLALVIGALLFAVSFAYHPAGETAESYLHPGWIPAHLIELPSMVLILFGLIGAHARQMDRAGRLGLAGFVLAVTGTVLLNGVVTVAATALPILAAQAPAAVVPGGALYSEATETVLTLSIGTFVVGYVLFAIATFRAGVLPRWAAPPLAIGALLLGGSEGELPWAAVIAGALAFSAGAAWVGYALWAVRRERPAMQPSLTPQPAH